MFTTAIIVAVAVLTVYIYLPQNATDDSIRLGSGQMFDKIARYYDGTNQLMSLGFHMMWKGVLVKEMEVRLTDKVMDLATGTGDIAIQFGMQMVEMNQANNFTRPRIVAIDPSKNMLDYAFQKVDQHGLSNLVSLQQGDAENLSAYEADSYDKVTISFGIRNFQNPGKALREIRRIMPSDFSKKGKAKLGILEFVAPRKGPLAKLATAFLMYVIPCIGSVMSFGKAKEYTHLKQSILDFPPPEVFSKQITDAGFHSCEARNIFFDTVYLFLCDAVDPKLEPPDSDSESVSELVKPTGASAPA